MIAVLALGAASCKKATSVDVTTSSISIPTEGGKSSFNVTASGHWNISSSASWISVSPKSGDGGPVTVTISASASTEPEPRSATLTITCEDVSKSVTVTQAQKDAIILGSTSATVSRKGGTLEVKLSNNVEYIVEVKDSWIKKGSKTKGLVSSSESFTIEPNETYEVRTGKIIFTDRKGGLKSEFLVTQSNNLAIILDTEAITLSSAENVVSFKYLTNSDVQFSFPSGQDWISVVEPTKALEERTFTIKVKENTGDKREGVIYLQDKNDPEIKDELKVTQQKKGGEYGQVITIGRKGKTFTSPELSGSGVTGEIVWGDGAVTALDKAEVHTFITEEGQITVNSKNATKVVFKDFMSLDAIDFSIFN